MSRRWRNYLLSAGLFLLGAARSLPGAAADDPGARSALEASLRRQEAVPYVEHLFARAPVMPAQTGALGELIRDRATQALRSKAAQGTSGAPGAAGIADRAMAQADTEEPHDTAGLTLGPETEIATIEHIGGKQRQRHAGGLSEIVLADGQMAVRLDLSVPVSQLRVAAASMTAEAAVDQARRIRDTIRMLPLSLAEGGPLKIIGLIIGTLDELQAQLGIARTAAHLLSVADQMAKASNSWRCTPDDDFGPPAQMLDVRRLEDEPFAGQPARVYQYTNRFRVPAEDGRSEPEVITTQTRIWVRVSDGLPVRSDVLLPEHRQRSEFEYGRAIDFAMPKCSAPDR